MDILFSGVSIHGETVVSDSILQGTHCEKKRIFLKHPRVKTGWVECDVSTVKQIK